MLKIAPAHPSFTEAVLAFELENRAHFEEWIASRGDHFYQMSQVRMSLAQAQAAAHAHQQKEYHFLAWLDDEMVGRVTLRGVEREYYYKATLGYRFSKKHAGKGFASYAVNTIAEMAFRQLDIHRIEAVVILENLASQAVMRKSGFTQYGHSRSSVLLHGVWHDMLLFERHAS